MTEPYKAETFLNPRKSIKPGRAIALTTALTYRDLLTYKHEGPDGFYYGGVGEMCLENADYRLLLNGHVLEESSEREENCNSRCDDYFELRKGDVLKLQWRYDGLNEHRAPLKCLALVFRAGLYVEEDVP